MQREPEPDPIRPEDLMLGADLEPAPPNEYHTIDPEPQRHLLADMPDQEPEHVKRVFDHTGETRRGAQPKPAPKGAASDVVDKCAEEPFIGHIKINDLAYILGIQPWNLQALPRSLKGYCTELTALREVERRGG